MLSPAASYTTLLFFPAVGGILDLASFSFQVPIFGLAAKPAATATKHRASVNTIVLVFMPLLLIEQQIYRLIEVEAILVLGRTFSNGNPRWLDLRNIGREERPGGNLLSQCAGDYFSKLALPSSCMLALRSNLDGPEHSRRNFHRFHHLVSFPLSGRRYLHCRSEPACGENQLRTSRTHPRSHHPQRSHLSQPRRRRKAALPVSPGSRHHAGWPLLQVAVAKNLQSLNRHPDRQHGLRSRCPQRQSVGYDCRGG